MSAVADAVDRIEFVPAKSATARLRRLPVGPVAGPPLPGEKIAVVYEERSGAEKTHPIVFLHNGGTNRSIWDPVIGVLDGEHRTFALDLPGYGQSDVPDHGYRRCDYADVIEQFLDEVVGQPAIVVGNCMGAAFGWTVTQRRPDRVAALGLINPLTYQTARRGLWGSLLPLSHRWDLGRLAGRVALPGALSLLTLVPQFGSNGVRAGLWRDRALAKQWSDWGRPRALAGLFYDIESYNELDDFVRPAEGWPWTFMAWGGSNRALSPRAGQRLAAGLRPDRSTVIAGAGHLAMLEEPANIASLIREASSMADSQAPD